MVAEACFRRDLLLFSDSTSINSDSTLVSSVILPSLVTPLRLQMNFVSLAMRKIHVF